MYKFIGLAGLASGAVAGMLPRGDSSSVPSCWSACFEKEGVTSESALCGNTAVDACIQDSCSAAEDKAYWAWYEEYCPTPTSSIPYPSASASVSVPAYSWSWSASSSSYPVSSAPVPSASGYPCWSACFAKEGVTSEADLCGNTAVDACIQDECSAEADKAYWAWYEGYCPAASTTPSSTVPASPTSTPSCWSTCFSQNGITAESQLCGNTAVDACIQSTCSAAEDKAYWAWYEEYCGGGATVTTWATVTSCSTYSSVWTSGAATGTSYWTSAPVASTPVAPYPTGGAQSGAAWGTGAAAPTSSGWVAPATGAGVVNKPAFALVAGVVALAAFFH